MSDLAGAFAVLEDGRWIVAQQSALSMFGGGDAGSEEYLEKWSRAGAVRDDHVHCRESTQKPPHRDEDRLWPTPAASMPNDGEEPAQWLRRFIRVATAEDATRHGVPLAVAARAPQVLLLAKIGQVQNARDVLARHEEQPDPNLASKDLVNPRWVERLMGFSEGWTEV